VGAYRHLPPSAAKLRGRALLDACREHVLDYARRMRGKVYVWDVVNEAATNVELWKEIGWENFPGAFRWTRGADPNVLLSYNDYGIVDDNRPRQRAKVRKRIQYLLDHPADLPRGLAR
jgi:GH35 family endo-1,4-beta-xylanase